MVYGKRRRYSKARYQIRRRRNFRKGGRSVKLIRRIAKGAIRRAAETKYVYVPGSSSSVEAATPIAAFVIPAIPQGLGSENRIGNRIMCLRNSFRGTISIAAVGSSPITTRVRIVIGRLKDMENAPANLSIGNILDTTTASTYINSQINFDVFHAYYDKMKRLSTTNNVGYQTYGYTTFFDWKTSIKWRKSVGFQGDTAGPNINDYDKYLVFCVFTDQVGTGQLTINSSYQCKYSYLDL